jgi:hypothetical protein
MWGLVPHGDLPGDGEAPGFHVRRIDPFKELNMHGSWFRRTVGASGVAFGPQGSLTAARRMEGCMTRTALAAACLTAVLLPGAPLAYATPLTLEISLGIRETAAGGGPLGAIGSDGGTAGGIEHVNLDGQSFVADGTWQLFTFTASRDSLTAFAGATANSALDGTYGVFEHIRFRSTGDPGPWVIYIDDIVNVTFAGSSTITGFESFATGTEVMFQEPHFSGSTAANFAPTSANTAAVSDEAAHGGSQSYKVAFEFLDDNALRWLRLTSFNAPNVPNPQVILSEIGAPEPPTISFWLMAEARNTPVPEPATPGLFGLGLAGLAIARRTRTGRSAAAPSAARHQQSQAFKELQMSRFSCLFLLPLALLFASVPARAVPMQPDGLAPGETYHWMFLTRGAIDAMSADIAVYNAFVNVEAALNPDLSGLTWRAIASTEAIDARVNAPVHGPVFLLDGSRFADDFLDMWDGSNVPANAIPEIDQFGVVREPDPTPWVWTGTFFDGTVQGLGLGDSQPWAGRYTSVFPAWLIDVHLSSFSPHPMYALSFPIKAETVPSVAEPSSLTFVALALGGLALRRRASCGEVRGLARRGGRA